MRRRSSAFLVGVGLGLLWAAPALAHEPCWSDQGPSPLPLNQTEWVVFGIGLLLALKTLHSGIQNRPWSATAEERARRPAIDRTRRQLVGLLFGAVLGAGLIPAYVQLHNRVHAPPDYILERDRGPYIPDSEQRLKVYAAIQGQQQRRYEPPHRPLLGVVPPVVVGAAGALLGIVLVPRRRADATGGTEPAAA